MMATVPVDITRLSNGAEIPLPSYKTTGAAGMDLAAAVDNSIEITPGDRQLIPTGFAISLPDGYEAQIRPRSGLACKQGLTVANAPGTIDQDYRGEIAVLLINLGKYPVTISRGMRIAQMVVAPVTQCHLNVIENLDESDRGSAGFGSTGV